MDAVSQYLFSGLSSGCVFALVALGLVLIARVTGVYNFAQGEYIMVGGVVFALTTQAGLPILAAGAAGVVSVAVVAFVQERLTVAPIRKSTSPLGLAVVSLGFGVTLRGIALIVVGRDPISVDSFVPGTFEFLGARLDLQTLWVWGMTLLLLTALVVLLQFTTIGKAMRASASNLVAANLLGIRTSRMSTLAFVLAGAMTGLAGVVVVPLSAVSWSSGVSIGLIGFIAAAVADFKRPVIAVVVGLAMGVIQNLAAGLISSDYRDVFVYGALLVYFVVRDLAGEDGLIRRAALAGISRPSRTGAKRTPSSRATSLPIGSSGVTAPPQRRPLAISLLPVILVAALAVVPLLLTSDAQAMNAAVFIILTSIAATGLVLVMGLGGMLSLGHAAFCLVSGYTVAILTVRFGWPPLLAILIAVIAAIVVGLIVGVLTLRLSAFNLAISTLAILLMLLVWVSQATALTGGIRGTIGVPPLEAFGFTTSLTPDRLVGSRDR